MNILFYIYEMLINVESIEPSTLSLRRTYQSALLSYNWHLVLSFHHKTTVDDVAEM